VLGRSSHSRRARSMLLACPLVGGRLGLWLRSRSGGLLGTESDSRECAAPSTGPQGADARGPESLSTPLRVRPALHRQTARRDRGEGPPRHGNDGSCSIIARLPEERRQQVRCRSLEVLVALEALEDVTMLAFGSWDTVSDSHRRWSFRAGPYDRPSSGRFHSGRPENRCLNA